MRSDRATERGRRDTDGEAEYDVDHGADALGVFGKTVRLEHPGREGRVRPERGGARKQQQLTFDGQTGEQTKQQCTARIDRERADRKVAGNSHGDQRVQQESCGSANPTEQRHADPNPGAHTITRVRRTIAVPTQIATYPAPMLVAA